MGRDCITEEQLRLVIRYKASGKAIKRLAAITRHQQMLVNDTLVSGNLEAIGSLGAALSTAVRNPRAQDERVWRIMWEPRSKTQSKLTTTTKNGTLLHPSL